MGLFDILNSLNEMNKDAASDAARLSTDELCYKVNTLNVIMNPLIYVSCSEELTRRTHSMTNEQLMDYYYEYATRERTDAKEILEQELTKRGLLESSNDID